MLKIDVFEIEPVFYYTIYEKKTHHPQMVISLVIRRFHHISHDLPMIRSCSRVISRNTFHSNLKSKIYDLNELYHSKRG